MADIKITFGEIEVEAKDLDPLQVFKLLEQFLFNKNIAVTANQDEPVSINFPAMKENLLEPQEKKLYERDEPYEYDDIRTPRLDLGTAGILCVVNCPECSDNHERVITIGKLFNCKVCQTALFHEPHIQGMYKAVQRYEFKGDKRNA